MQQICRHVEDEATVDAEKTLSKTKQKIIFNLCWKMANNL
jgi:hypothetical protein